MAIGPIGRATLRTSAVLGLRLMAQAGTLILVARLLGPHGFGAFAGIAALAVMIGTLSTFGTHIVLLGEVSHDPHRREAVLPFALTTTLICGILLFSIYMLLATLFLGDAKVGSDVLIALGLAELILQPLVSLSSAEHQGHGRIATSQMLMTLPLLLRLFAATSIWLLQPNDPLHLYAYGYFCASALALFVAIAGLHTPWPHPRQWRLPKIQELRHAAGYALLNLTAAGPSELDKTLALRLLPLSAAGVYAAGARIIGALTLPVIAMMLSAMPRLFREGQTYQQRSGRLLRWLYFATMIYSTLLASILWLTAPLFDQIFGAHYNGLGSTLRWLSLAIPGMALRIAAGSSLMAMSKPWRRAGFEFTGLAVLILTAMFFAPHLPIDGMPLALASAEWTMALIGTLMIFATPNRTHAKP